MHLAIVTDSQSLTRDIKKHPFALGFYSIRRSLFSPQLRASKGVSQQGQGTYSNSYSDSVGSGNVAFRLPRRFDVPEAVRAGIEIKRKAKSVEEQNDIMIGN